MYNKNKYNEKENNYTVIIRPLEGKTSIIILKYSIPLIRISKSE